MNIDLIITFAIIIVGVFLFVRDYFTIDTTSILIMAMFIVAGVLTPEEGFSGFNHPATLTLGCIFVLSAGIFKSGILDNLSYSIIRIAKVNYVMALIIFCLISGVFSAFINDTAVVALLLPIALTVCKEANIKPSRLLMPISFAALFGGTCTLIGTSTNILVSSYSKKYGVEAFGMFEFSLAALCLMAIGFTYLFVFSPLLLPKKREVEEDFTINAENYITELIISDECKDVGKSIANSDLVKEYNINILSILRGGILIHEFSSETKIFKGDTLKVIAIPKTLNRLLDVDGIKISGAQLVTSGNEDSQGYHIYEVIIPFGSDLMGNSLKELHFRRRFNCSVIAIRQRGEVMYDKLSLVNLKEGDMLLIIGKEEDIKQLEVKNRIVRLTEHEKKLVDLKKAIPAIIIGVLVVLTAALNITTILISGMVGALLMILLGILKPKEAYQAVEWKVIFMVAGVLSMGTALEKTGGAQLIADGIQASLGQYNAHVTLSVLYLVTFLSTNLISSKATAALMTPVVISLAALMGVSERPFLVAVMFACSLTFMTPMSYPTNTMVYAPGNYKFSDFLKVGTPLNIIIWLAASFIIPYFFPFAK
ncbi:SLC13 family permease [Mangrovimonas sp. CR14]|uniref:SLC13 family permease n=1 Tax=Mangrovimonas sp. CR14 TaxID=2706120 RepID=UPI00141F5D32|nr:SLC13 family permease [Mangrovimonas sp. CR14]NIK90933.1 SLC13 family permease [Mangrovimonas sp. CR14]